MSWIRASVIPMSCWRVQAEWPLNILFSLLWIHLSALYFGFFFSMYLASCVHVSLLCTLSFFYLPQRNFVFRHNHKITSSSDSSFLTYFLNHGNSWFILLVYLHSWYSCSNQYFPVDLSFHCHISGAHYCWLLLRNNFSHCSGDSAHKSLLSHLN